jgi:hypothetical protein
MPIWLVISPSSIWSVTARAIAKTMMWKCWVHETRGSIFFEQPSGISVTEALIQDAEEYQGEVLGTFMLFDYTDADEVRRRGRELVGKFVRVKSEVQARVDETIPVGVHQDILGVHVRGTDMRRDFHSLHPIPAHPQTYLEEAIALDRKQGFTRIFLGCDEVETVELFRNHFESRLITTTAHRTPVGKDLGKGYGWLFHENRPLHRYLLGLEVLLDALLLARCGHFLCGCSNVSQAVMYLSDESQEVHFVPPIWRVPLHERDDSVGREFVASFPPLSAALSPEALAQQLEEMRLVLEAAENSRAQALRTIEKDNAEKIATLQAQLAEAEEIRRHLDSEMKALKREVTAAHEETEGLSSMRSRLECRVRYLMDWWTWLGWRLRPWKKPSWRHGPLK